MFRAITTLAVFKKYATKSNNNHYIYNIYWLCDSAYFVGYGSIA